MAHTSRLQKLPIAIFFCAAALLLAVCLPRLRAKTANRPQRTPTKWLITVNLAAAANANNDVPTYTFSPGPHDADCPSDTIGQKDLCVNAGDSVAWKVTTSTHGAHFVIYQGDLILGDPSDSQKKVRRLEAEDSHATGDSTINSPGTWEYCLAANDASAPHFYIDDPKIIVGGGGTMPVGQLLHVIRLDVEKLQQVKVVRDDTQAKNDADKILQIIQDIRAQLHLQ